MAPTFIKVTIMTNEEILKVFLKKKQLYVSFCGQRVEFRVKAFESTNNYSILSAIDAAFTWSKTKEGHEYWKYIDKEWKTMCNNFGLNGYINLMKV